MDMAPDCRSTLSANPPSPRRAPSASSRQAQIYRPTIFVPPEGLMSEVLDGTARLVPGPSAACIASTDESTKSFIFYNPPVVNKELGLRRSALLEATDLATQLLANDIQTIVFGRTRTTVEVLLTYLQSAAESSSRHRDRAGGALADPGAMQLWPTASARG